MTDGQMRRFAQWQDGLTLDILDQSIPAIADDLADWYCRNHTPALDPASFPEALRAALLRRICAWCGNGSQPDMPSTPAPATSRPAGRRAATASTTPMGFDTVPAVACTLELITGARWADHCNDVIEIHDEITIPGQEARYGETPAWLAESATWPAVKAQTAGSQLYLHQAMGLELLGQGHNLVINTGTASGKSLVFQAPTLHHLATHPNATAVAIYPIKALARDQVIHWQSMAEAAGPNLDSINRIDGNVRDLAEVKTGRRIPHRRGTVGTQLGMDGGRTHPGSGNTPRLALSGRRMEVCRLGPIGTAQRP